MRARNLKPSTTKNYKLDWNLRLKALTAGDGMSLKDYHTEHVQGWLNSIADDGKLSRNSVKGSRAFMSSLFKAAKRLGYYRNANPVEGTKIDQRLRGAEDTKAYSLEEILTIIAALSEPARTIFGIAAFAGLRRGEIEGLKWENYRDGELHVEFSVWAGKIGTPKSKSSRAAVPVIKQLEDMLKAHHEREGKRNSGWIFNTSANTPLSLHNVVNRQILPTFEAKRERDQTFPEWHGFHAARRGIGSNLNRLGVDDSFIQRILRHSNISTTQSFYIKTTATDVQESMKKYEAEIARIQAEMERLRATIVPPADSAVEKPNFVN